MEQEDNLSHPIFDGFGVFNKRLFSHVCRSSYVRQSQDVNYNDWKTLVSLLVEMGFVHLYSDNILIELDTRERHGLSITTRSQWYYRPDRNRRIVKIGLISENTPCVLPRSIRRLDQLKFLDIKNVISLPFQELSLLPQLKIMCVEGFSEILFRNIRASHPLLKLPTVEHLYLCGKPSFQMVHRCETLRVLTIDLFEPDYIDIFLDVLCSSYLCFSGKLMKLELRGNSWPVRARHLEMLLFQAVPRLPNLTKLKFDGNLNIRCFKIVADRIRSDKECTVPKSLQHLDFRYFHGYGDLLQINRDSDIRKDVLTFLNTFTSVGNVKFPRGIKIRTCWKYALLTNCMGRSLLEDNGVSSLPISVWPIVLDGSQQKVEKRFSHWGKQKINLKATGICYLLRNSPILFIQRQPRTDNPHESPPIPKRQRQG